MTRILGAVLAGGRSVRFGSDKAEAVIGGRRLIDHAIAALAGQVEALVLCGRAMPDQVALADRPAGRHGPLAGIAAALHHARNHGYDAVLSVPCDVPGLPADLVRRLHPAGTGGVFVEECPVIGLWPVALAEALDRHLAEGGRSMRSWTARSGARAHGLGLPLVNVNRPEDLMRASGAIG